MFYKCLSGLGSEPACDFVTSFSQQLSESGPWARRCDINLKGLIFEMGTQQFNNLPEGIMMDFEPYCSDCKAVSPEVLSDKIFVDNTTCVTHRIACQWRKQCKQLHKMVEKKYEKENS